MDVQAYADYALAKAIAEAARINYNHASVSLDRARIDERLAEIKSQHEPIHSKIVAVAGHDSELIKKLQDLIFSSCDYVVRSKEIK